jgi:ribosomal protein S12 methylthiotransferase accessory factor
VGFSNPRECISSFGRSVDDPAAARLIAIAEGAERYASGDFLGELVVLARASELDGDVLDASRIPRCSEREYAHPACPLIPFDPEATIRWTRGVDLASGREIWVPAVMACYRLQDLLPQEKFWYQISTGCAVHTGLAEALVQGIFEVVERDAVALIWLQQLALPDFRPASPPPAPEAGAALREEVGYLLDWGARHCIETHLLDATTDLGVPTVYCLQVAEHDDYAHQVVGCATSRDMMSAAKKALLETTLIRLANYVAIDNLPRSPERFTSFIDGGLYMGVRERSHAFAFLREQRRTQDSALPRMDLPDEPDEALRCLVQALSSQGVQVIAVDRTTRELADVGLTAVKVLIPDLQPMSLHPFAQFCGHPRLWEAPAAMGLRALPEGELNPWPQPFM